MPYLIDGHNLIPKIPGLSLQDADDEDQLIELLQNFCRLKRKEAEVFFDNAPPGGQRARVLGLVTARYIRQGTSADDAIRARLQRLARSAANWTVVSSDQAIQVAARAARAHVLTAEAFASLLAQTFDETARDPGESQQPALDDGELDDWLKLFGG
jgi:hypothetical protein